MSPFMGMPFLPRPVAPVASLLVALALSGCVRKTESTIPDVPITSHPEPKVAADPRARANDLSNAAEQFAATTRRLPGNSDAEHRQVVQQAFADLGKVLPLLAGPEPGGALEQRTRTIDSARTRIGGETTAPADPAIDEGLRAAAGALRDVARAKYAGQGQINQALDRLDKTVAELDVARGGPHRAAAADALRQMADVIHAMSDALAAQTAPPTATPGPTTRPSAP